jgi:hypothetical protein
LLIHLYTPILTFNDFQKYPSPATQLSTCELLRHETVTVYQNATKMPFIGDPLSNQKPVPLALTELTPAAEPVFSSTTLRG